MFQKVFLSLLIGALLLAAQAFEIDNSWTLVIPPDADETQKFAALELSDYLFKTAGLTLKTVPRALPGGNSILFEYGKYAEEEWHVEYDKSRNILVIGGGYRRGLIYGVYEFIEQALGCRFLTKNEEYIPKLTKVTLPDNFKAAGKPFFEGRGIYSGAEGWADKERLAFHVKQKYNNYYSPLKAGWYLRLVSNLQCHTYHLYSAKFPQDKEEYFSLSKQGKRLRPLSGAGPGQLCLANKESRRLVVEKMREIIEKDHETLQKTDKGAPFSRIIDFSANDNPDKCECPDCLALAEKYSTYCGAMLDYTNEVAAGIEKYYPGTIVQAFAYEHTEDPPTGILPRKNVLIHIAQLGMEYGPPNVRDAMRSLTHPNNQESLRRLQQWGKTGASIKIWDYWNVYHHRFLFPFTCVSAIPENIKIYSRNNVKMIFSEAEEIMNNRLTGCSFLALRNYLGAKSMVNPDIDPKAVISDFMLHYYGPSAEPMTELLNYIESRMNEEPGVIGWTLSLSKYLDKPFFKDGERLLEKAEKAANGSSVYLERIGTERIFFDHAMLNLDARLHLNIDRKAVLKRLRENYMRTFRKECEEPFWKKNAGALEEWFHSMENQPPLPKQFQDKICHDFTLPELGNGGLNCSVVDDPEAVGGKAVKLTGIGRTSKEVPNGFHSKNLSFGVYDRDGKKPLLSKVVPREEMATDEKYHWYHIGNTPLTKKTLVWVHWSWWVNVFPGDQVFDPLLPENKYAVWVSIKLEGPSYSPGSKKEDAVLFERVIFTRPEK